MNFQSSLSYSPTSYTKTAMLPAPFLPNDGNERRSTKVTFTLKPPFPSTITRVRDPQMPHSHRTATTTSYSSVSSASSRIFNKAFVGTRKWSVLKLRLVSLIWLILIRHNCQTRDLRELYTSRCHTTLLREVYKVGIFPSFFILHFSLFQKSSSASRALELDLLSWMYLMDLSNLKFLKKKFEWFK